MTEQFGKKSLYYKNSIEYLRQMAYNNIKEHWNG